jgi:hypothetical protein
MSAVGGQVPVRLEVPARTVSSALGEAPSAAEAMAAELIDELPDGSSALVLAIEHLWAVPLRDHVGGGASASRRP